MIRELLKKLVYPHKYSTEAYVKYIRSGGGQIGKNCRFYGPTSITIDSTSFPFISMGDNVVLTEDVIHDLGDLKSALAEAFEIKKDRYKYETLGKHKTCLLLRPHRFCLSDTGRQAAVFS